MPLIRHPPTLPSSLTIASTTKSLLLCNNNNIISINLPSQQPSYIQTQIRHATFIPRPRRPYTFTQLVTLSDGSTYLHRTTSPAPVYKSIKDTRDTQLWNPSSQRLMNMEADEAGRLRAFRGRFGRGWDSKRGKEIEVDDDGVEVGEGVEGLELVSDADAELGSRVGRGEQIGADGAEKKEQGMAKGDGEDEPEDNLLDLISSPEFDTGIRLGPKEKKKRRRGK